MQGLDKRLRSLETAEAKCQPLGHLTGAELDERIATLRARIAAHDEDTTNEGKHHAEH